MSLYTIDGVINSVTKQPEERNADKIGQIVEIDVDNVVKGKSFTMKNEEESTIIKTSSVKNCFIDGDEVYIETKNSIYKLSKK